MSARVGRAVAVALAFSLCACPDRGTGDAAVPLSSDRLSLCNAASRILEFSCIDDGKTVKAFATDCGLTHPLTIEFVSSAKTKSRPQDAIRCASGITVGRPLGRETHLRVFPDADGLIEIRAGWVDDDRAKKFIHVPSGRGDR